MSVRSGPLFVTSLLLLAASASLGLVLLHDGEVGTDEAKLAYTDAGDDVTVKGMLVRFVVPTTDAWSLHADAFHHATYQLDVEGIDAVVLVTGLADDLADEDVVVSGDVMWNGPHPEAGLLLILDAQAITVPFFAW